MNDAIACKYFQKVRIRCIVSKILETNKIFFNKIRIACVFYCRFYYCRDKVDPLANACFICFSMFKGFQRQKHKKHRQVKRCMLGAIINIFSGIKIIAACDVIHACTTYFTYMDCIPMLIYYQRKLLHQMHANIAQQQNDI